MLLLNIFLNLLLFKNSRERRESHINARAGRRSRVLTKNDDTEFATGLIIGESIF